MQREEFERDAIVGVEEWMQKMEVATRDTTINRMALALLTATNAVLGRPPKPRSRRETIEELQRHTDALTCWKSEQQIMEGRNDDEHMGLLFRASEVARLARLFDKYATASASKQEVLVGLYAETFFSFAQKECARQGHGIEGLIRAVGIVIGEVSLEEVVFG
jgi:hypothetical protein